MIFKAKRLTLQYHKNTLLGSWDNCTTVFFLSTGVHHPLFLLSLKRKIFFISNILYLRLTRCRRGIVEFSGLFVALRMGQPWEQPRPGVIWGRKARRGRQAGGGQGAGGRASALPAFGGFGTPSMRVPRGLAAISAHFGRACRPSLSGRACRPAPCALPSPCLRGVCPFRLLGSMPGRGCSHGCAWLAYLRSFRFLLANTRFSAICDNF